MHCTKIVYQVLVGWQVFLLLEAEEDVEETLRREFLQETQGRLQELVECGPGGGQEDGWRGWWGAWSGLVEAVGLEDGVGWPA